VYRNEADSIYMHACRALELLDADSRPARTAAHCALGVAQMFRGDRVAASVAFTKVIGAGQSSGNLMFTAVASTALAGIQVTDYKLHLAAATYREVIQMIADPYHVLGYEAHLGLAKILYDWNELEEAESLAFQCSELVTFAKSESEIGADLLRARLLLAHNVPTDAEALLAHIVRLVDVAQLTDRMREASELLVLQMVRHGEVDAAADLAYKHNLPVGLARVLLAQGKGLDALQAVEDYRRTMEAEVRTQDALKAMVVQAIIQNSVGQTAQALQLLREAVTRAQSQGSIRLFVDEGAHMQAMLSQLPHETGIAQYVSKLLDAFSTQATQEKRVAALTSTTPSHLPLSPFSQRELAVLRLIQEGHSNQSISEKLFLSLSTVKWHNQNIFSKLDVQRRTEAVARAIQLKLL
jgi:LuxR family maltose regulon positive regulatory protein